MLQVVENLKSFEVGKFYDHELKYYWHIIIYTGEKTGKFYGIELIAKQNFIDEKKIIQRKEIWFNDIERVGEIIERMKGDL